MRFIQYLDDDGNQRVGCTSTDAGRVRRLDGTATLLALAQAAFDHGRSLVHMAESRLGALEATPLDRLLDGLRVLTPLMHDDPAHCLVSGTGLTHLGSAATRDAMHHKLGAQGEESLSDSMRMFKWGLERGRPAHGQAGVQPEWFYKGDGRIVIAPGAPLPSPSFALDAGEEPELVGLYWIAPDGTPCRLGVAVGNEFSDHVTERQNYLYLANSKLRVCSVGPELLAGPAPSDLQGTSRIRRGDQVVWQKPFATGEAHMSHSLENLEYHHFKYPQHRRPGDVHLHFFGTATLSCADGVVVEPGDRFEIEQPLLGAALVNPVVIDTDAFTPGGVRTL